MIGQYPGDRAGTYTGDAGILSGSPTLTGAGLWLMGQIDFVDYTHLAMNAGDSIVVASAQDWSVLPIPDPVVRGYWMVRSTGSGTLALADGYATGFGWPTPDAAFVDVTLEGTDSTFRYWNMPNHLNNDDMTMNGSPLLRISCTSGSVDITFVGLRIEGPAGFHLPTGESDWSAVVPASSRALADDGSATWSRYVDGGIQYWAIDDMPVIVPDMNGHYNGVSEPVDMLPPPDDRAASNERGLGALADAATTFSPPVVAGSGVIGPGYSIQNPPIPPFPPNPFYHYVPGTVRHFADFEVAPSKSDLPSLPPEGDVVPPDVTEIEWMDEDTDFMGWRLWEQFEAISPIDDVTLATFAYYLTAEGTASYGEFTLSVGTQDTGGLLVTDDEVAQARVGDWDLVEEMEIPTSDQLVSVFIFCNPVPDPDSGDYPDGQLQGGLHAIQNDPYNEDARLGNPWAKGVFRVPPYRYRTAVYSPAPAIARLNVRLPSDEWRLIGLESGSATERQKVETPDLTWWKEYRTVDGDLPTRALKMWDGVGWIVVARMTPE